MATAKFPTSVATDADLLVAKNRAQTTLVGALNASDTTFTLASDAFAVNVAITIDSEIILITAKSGATVTACTRGYDGTAAASHTNGKLVSAYVDAIHHNQVSAEIQAIETALGAAMVNVPSVTYPIAINKGGTGATTQSAALTAIMGSSALPIANGGTGAATQSAALTALMGAASLPIAVGGTAATTAAGARAALSAAILGANNDITSLTALSTPLSVAQGGTGAATLTGIPVGSGTAALSVAAAASQLQELRRKPNVTGVVYEFFSPDRTVSTDYNFPVQATPENLSPSLKTVTLTPVPLGVNGTDTAHYVAIFNNSGVFQESALINGGTATSGAASGTITFATLSGTYATGAYKIGSATAGIQEAIRTVTVANGLSAGPSVFVPAGTHTIYGTITNDNYASIMGAGSNSTILLKAFAAGDMLFVGTAASPLAGIGSAISDLQIRILPGITDASGYAIHVNWRYNVTVRDVTIYGDPNVGIGQIKNGIKFENALTFSLYNTKILNVKGIGLELASTPPDQVTGRIVGVDVTGDATSSLVYMHGNVLSLFIDGLQMQGGLTNWEIDTTGGAFTESTISNIVFDSAAGKAFNLHGTGNAFKISMNNLELSTVSGVPSLIGMVFDGTGAGIFTDFNVSNVVGGVNASNQTGTALFILSASNFLLSNSQLQGAGGAAGDTTVQIQGTTSNVVLTGNVLGYAYDGGRTGTVGTVGTAVTWTSGSQFVAAMQGNLINIGGSPYTVQTYNSATSLTLTASAGTQVAAPYQAQGGSSSEAYRAVYVPSGTHFGMTITGNRIYGDAVALSIGGAHTALQATGNALLAPTTTSFTGTGTAYFDNSADPAGLNGRTNYIATEGGANNAIAGTLSGATLAAGLQVRILLAHTLQIGANTFNLNAGGAVSIKSHLNVANNIAAAYAVGSVVTLWYDGTRWQDLGQ